MISRLEVGSAVARKGYGAASIWKVEIFDFGFWKADLTTFTYFNAEIPNQKSREPESLNPLSATRTSQPETRNSHLATRFRIFFPVSSCNSSFDLIQVYHC